MFLVLEIDCYNPDLPLYFIDINTITHNSCSDTSKRQTGPKHWS